ncbi:hypothetical protein BC936DRAFT_144542 [Jimgerdemannia flammicorona]|uniref:Uncharacterized protein n=1 Tax=Jimgerdemannia flammicorona TaxID=994334 RepID=A0A433DC75_9FUNG|nr:hypothetical protein BC936DRAFT_144542 [Jimgerdemannia flammicorona]
MLQREKSLWGWGYAHPPATVISLLEPSVAKLENLFPPTGVQLSLPNLDAVAKSLRKPRFELPVELKIFVTDDPWSRSRNIRDIIRGLNALTLQTTLLSPATNMTFRLPALSLPDVHLCYSLRRGSSVVAGVESHPSSTRTITVDLKVLKVDTHSLVARVQGGVFGPDLLRQLKSYGLTFRHFRGVRPWGDGPRRETVDTNGRTLCDEQDACGRLRGRRKNGDTIQTNLIPASGAGPSRGRRRFRGNFWYHHRCLASCAPGAGI